MKRTAWDRELLEAFLVGAACGSKTTAEAIAKLPAKAWETVCAELADEACRHDPKRKDHLNAWLRQMNVDVGDKVIESVIQFVLGRYQARQAIAADLGRRLCGARDVEAWVEDVLAGTKGMKR
jgi:hypothetical protein